MSDAVAVLNRCSECGWHGRPRRLWCPSCGSQTWQPVESTVGRILAITSVHRAGGIVLDPPPHMALVSLADSGSILCVMEHAGKVGDDVRVSPRGASFAAAAVPLSS